MDLKQISFQVKIKDPKDNTRDFPIQRAYTNDLNSVRLTFEMIDTTAAELSGATASILFYMLDRSFFQDTATVTGNKVEYTLTEAQGNHVGTAQVQIMVTVGGVTYASAKRKFDIVSGLEMAVATEVMIKDWTMLTAEARAYLDEAEANEAIRISNETARVAAENQRNNDFSSKADQTYTDAQLALKADKADTYTKAQVDGKDALKADKTTVEALNSRVDTIITTPAEGVSAQEIIDARQGEVSLGANIAEVKSQLAQKLTKGEVSVYDIDKNKGKLDQTYISDELLQQIAGNTPINAVPADGSLTTEKYADRSVTGSKIDGVVEIVENAVNLFNKNKIIEGGYYSRGTGEWTTNSGYVSSDFIPVVTNKTYKSSDNTVVITFYNNNYEYLIGTVLSNEGTVFSSNISIAYARLQIPVNSVDGLVFSLEETFPGVYVSYQPDYKFTDRWLIEDSINQLKGDKIEGVESKWEQTVNLFNKETAIQGGYYSPSTGAWTVNSGYYTNDFIPILPNVKYKKNVSGSIVFWDENKQFVTGLVGGTVFSTKNANVKYVTFAIKASGLETMMVTLENEYPNEYIPYSIKKYKFNDNWSILQAEEQKIETENINNRLSVIENTYDKNFNKPIELGLTDFSGYNQPYHPSVIYIEGGFAGYEYWMVQTPYPIGASPYRDRWESPVVYKSTNGIDWLTVANPLDDITPEEIATRDYMSDPHILYRTDTLTLEVWYRLTNKSNGTLTTILRKTTKDGVTWTNREIMIEAKNSTVIDFWRSPSIIWDNVGNQYRAWYQNDYGIYYNTSSDGKAWGTQQKLSLDIPHSHWHIDINFFSGEYHLLSYSLSQEVVYYTSEDGVNFVRRRKLLDSDDGNPLYSRGLYRSCSILDKEGKVRVYFSAETSYNQTRIGLMIADSINEMQGTQKLSSDMVVLQNGITLEDLYAEVVKLRNLVSQ